MNNNSNTTIYFMWCISVRIIISLIAKNTSVNYLPILGLISLIPAFSFIHMFYNKDKQNGDKGFSGAVIWWSNLRLIHSFMYLWFAYSAYNKDKDAWKILMIDTFIGFSAWYLHYYENVEF